MKKFIYLLSAGLLVLGSCTNDYDASCFKKNEDPVKNDTISPPKTDSIPVVVVEPILLTKLVHIYPTGFTSELEVLYDGNKIVSDTDQSNITRYTYTGDVITKIDKADLSGHVYSTAEYVYVNGKVDYVFSNEFGSCFKTKYQYNSDGTVSYSKFNSDTLRNDGSDTGVGGIYTFSEGNLVKQQIHNGSIESVTTYEYDSKNNPRVNVLGSNLLAGINMGFAVNNVIKKSLKSDNAGNIFTETISYSYEYDANGYPTKSTEISQIGDKFTTETSVYTY